MKIKIKLDARQAIEYGKNETEYYCNVDACDSEYNPFDPEGFKADLKRYQRMEGENRIRVIHRRRS